MKQLVQLCRPRHRALRPLHLLIVSAVVLLAVETFVPTLYAQQAPPADDPQDYAQLFEQGQNAHEKGDLARAIEFYDRAIALHPEFAEAEYQRASALISLNRFAEAEKSLRRATELRPEWSLAWASLGSLLMDLGKISEAEPILEQALKLDQRSYPALTALVDLRLRGKPSPASLKPLLDQLRAATTGSRVPASVWAARAAIERASGNSAEALTSAEQALQSDPRNVNALLVRSELHADAGDLDRAIDDALAAVMLAPGRAPGIIVLARAYARASRTSDALRTLDTLPEAARNSPAATEIRAASVRCEGTPENLAVLEKALAASPKDPGLLACLGAAYRRVDPKRSLDYYAQAAAIEPDRIEHAIGYAGALIQARRFEEAVAILRRVLEKEPDNFTAHASLGTALYELKRYPESLTEFQWVIEQKPDSAVVYYFIATANDSSGRYVEALAAYGKFLNLADPAVNKLEIEKVNLRLPAVRKLASRSGSRSKS
jgi:tetratricopeptide (TPR) repeat protein